MQVLINGLRIHFQVFGSGPSVVVLHGWGDSSSSWYSFAEHLAKHCQVFLLDLPGFGHSDPPAQAWGIKDYENAVLGFITELGIEKPILLGHSHGGKIASAICGHTDVCSGLVLAGASGLNRRTLSTSTKIYFYKAAKLLLRPLGNHGKTLLSILRDKLGSRDYQEASTMRPTLVRVVNQKVFSIVSKIKIPTLIVWGSEDKILDVKLAKRFERLIPNSYIRLIWGGSHFFHIEAPKEFANIVLDFVPAK